MDQEVVTDTALFAAAVRELYSLPKVPARVDPRPTLPNAPMLATVPEEVVAARAAVLRRMQIATTDAFSDERCVGGSLSPPPVVVPNTTCPASGQYYSYILSLPYRREDTEGGTSASSDGASRWFIRVISRIMDPAGSSGAVNDFVFTRTREGRWRFVGRINLVVE
jgi:hypothetical protein